MKKKKKKKKKKRNTAPKPTEQGRKIVDLICGGWNRWVCCNFVLGLCHHRWRGARQLARSMSNGDLLQLWYESPSDKWKPFFTVTTFWKLLSSKLAFLMILMLGREDKASKGRVWRGCVWEEKMKKVKEWCWMKWVWFGMKESRWGVKADHWSDYTLTVGPITWVKLQFCHFHDSKEPETCFHFQSLITHFGENWAKETNLEKPSKQALPP